MAIFNSRTSNPNSDKHDHHGTGSESNLTIGYQKSGHWFFDRGFEYAYW